MAVEYYKPPFINRYRSLLYLKTGQHPYKKELSRIKHEQSPYTKIVALVELLESYHLDTLAHTFEVVYMATVMAKNYFDNLAKKMSLPEGFFDQKVEEVFLGGLIHDIGKIIVPVEILNRQGSLKPKEARILYLHDQLGSAILNEVGLSELAYFCNEHHIGNTNRKGFFNDKDFTKRHGLTEFISLADMFCGMLDPRRKYHKPVELKNAFEIVHEKFETGVFSRGLKQSYINSIIKNKEFPLQIKLI